MIYPRTALFLAKQVSESTARKEIIKIMKNILIITSWRIVG